MRELGECARGNLIRNMASKFARRLEVSEIDGHDRDVGCGEFGDCLAQSLDISINVTSIANRKSKALRSGSAAKDVVLRGWSASNWSR